MFSKKTAVAAAALLAAFAAQAQSSVNVYGNLDVSVGRFEEPGVQSVTAVQSGNLRESFIGFRGEEDLGGGLKGFFKLESALAVDTGATASNFWSRTSVVGLTGDFGTVTLGNARTLLFQANDAYNPFRADSNLFGTSGLVLGTTLATGVSSAYTTNWANSVTYSTPNWSGFTGAVQVRASEINDVDPSLALALGYVAGPLALNFTYQNVTLNTAGNDIKTWLGNASYDFGVVKLFGQYGQADQDLTTEKQKYFQVGVNVPVTSAGNVLVSYAEGKFVSNKAKEFSVAYEHSLSKRTGAYIGVNSTRYNFLPANVDRTGNSFAAGVRHAF